MNSPIRILLCACAAFAAAPLLPARAQEAAPAQPAVEAPAAIPAAPSPAAVLATPAVRVVDSAKNTEAVVSMVFDETPIIDVIKAFRDATGSNIIAGGTNLQGTVSVRLDNVPWRKGLSSILEQQGLQLVEQPAGSQIFVVTEQTFEIPLITRTFELEHAKADDVAKLFSTTLGKIGTATPFPSANVVIVTASDKQINECESILKSVDKPRPQVYIEARFVEMSADASKQLGMKWNSLAEWGVELHDITGGMEMNRGKLNTPDTHTVEFQSVNGVDTPIPQRLVPEAISDAPGAGRTADNMKWSSARGIGGQISADKFRLALSAFEQMNGVSVFSNPKIIVANEETARVDMTTKEPNVEVEFQAATQQGQRDSVSTKLAVIPGKVEPFVGEAFFSYGITMTVTPRISPSGTITVEIVPSISQLDSYFSPSGLADDLPVSRFPLIKMQRMETTFTMSSGSTAVIGGLTQTRESNTDSGIPYLRKIPWIGPRLFGWKGRGKEQREIIIFVTVGIADPLSMRQDVGLPKNAVLSRDVVTGKVKEPGDRTIDSILRIEDPALPGFGNGKRAQEAAPAEAAPAEAQKPDPAPAAAKP